MRLTIMLLLLVPVRLVHAEDKVPPPDAESLGKATALIRELYKEKYEETTTKEQKQALAADLFKKAQTLQSDAATRYVLLREAGRYSVKAGDMKLALQVIEEMDRTFQIDAAKLKAAVVAAIQTTWATEKPAATRIRLEVSESGEGSFRTETTSEETDAFPGTDLTLKHWPHTKVTKGRDGVLRFVHDFRRSDNLETMTLAGFSHDVAIDASQGVLAFTPGPMPKESDAKTASLFAYRRTVFLPFTLSCDIVQWGDGTFVMKVFDPMQQIGVIACSVSSSQQGRRRSYQTHVGGSQTSESGKKAAIELATHQSSERTFQRTFRLPWAGKKITEGFWIQLVLVNGEEPTTISRLEVRGRIASSFGMAMGTNDKGVFVHKVFPNTTAEAAGVKVGDVLKSIGGRSPKTAQEAVGVLGRLPLGEETVFVIERDGEPQTIRVVAE